MSTNTDTNRLFAEIAEKLGKEAYAAGWRDAFAAINKLADEVPPPESGANPIWAGIASLTILIYDDDIIYHTDKDNADTS